MITIGYSSFLKVVFARRPYNTLLHIKSNAIITANEKSLVNLINITSGVVRAIVYSANKATQRTATVKNALMLIFFISLTLMLNWDPMIFLYGIALLVEL